MTRRIAIATSYTSRVPHCLRRVDTSLHYPADLNGEVHHDGQIWSRAVWDIRQAIGNVRADTLILEAQFDSPVRRCAISRRQLWRPPIRCTDAPSPRKCAPPSSTAVC